MSDLKSLTEILQAGTELSAAQVEAASIALAGEADSDEAKAAFLHALSTKGETANEVAAFAASFRSRALDPAVGEYSPRALDIVGTGGDHAGGFNISSMVTLVLACAGVPVMKHGNRGITSKCGSADLFAAMGLDLEAPAPKVRQSLQTLGFAFFFAPAWHPAFRRIAPVRKLLAARGERTVFNILGPLLNPGRPAHVILGAASVALTDKLSQALDVLGTSGSLAVHGVISPGKGIDELTSCTANCVRGSGRLRGLCEEWQPEDFGLVRSPFDDIRGGDVAENLALARALAGGSGPAGLVDTVCLNSAVGLWLTGARPQIAPAIAEAREFLQGGAVARKMADTRDFFASKS